MKDFKLRLIMVFVILLTTFLINTPASIGLCCGDTCYEYGTCNIDGWYEGCKDISGSAHSPGTNLGCLKCLCSGKNDCNWYPNDIKCKTDNGNDYFCLYDKNTLPSSVSSVCKDRDESENFCSAKVCSDRPGYWIQHGEFVSLKQYDSGNWEYYFEDLFNQGSDNLLSITNRQKRCCQDDQDEFYITNEVGNLGTRSACCASPNSCVDKDGFCQNEKEAETSCDDGFDNDCNGLIDQEDPGCCPNSDHNANCCTSAGGVYNTIAKNCCGDLPNDNGFIKDNRFLCYIKDNSKMWLDLLDANTAGKVFTINHPDYTEYEILKSNTGFATCDSENDGASSTTSLTSSQGTVESKRPPRTDVHSYLCYTSTDSKEKFAECTGNKVPYSSISTGGTRHNEGQSVTDKQENKKYCCTGITNGWVNDLDNPSCINPPEGLSKTACELAGNNYKLAKSGEKESTSTPNLGKFGNTVCCGDDSYDNYNETTIDNTKYTACCDKQTDCVDATGSCRNETQGEQSCDDNIDNDCDGKIDTLDPDCCGDGDSNKNCCELRGGKWSNGMCCGDDTPEYEIDSSETYPDASPPNTKTQACCPSKTDCVYNNKCHISEKDGGKENAGNGCYDGFDNDCDGGYDFYETYKYSDGVAEIQGTAVSEEDRFRNANSIPDEDCVVTISGKVLAEGGETLEGKEFEIRMSGKFNRPYKNKEPKLVYEAFTNNKGEFTILFVNGDSSYDLTVLDPDEEYEAKTIPITINGFNDKKDLEIQLGIEHATCNSDCTSIGNTICNRECDAELGLEAHERCFFGGQETSASVRKKVRDLCHDQASDTIIDYPDLKDDNGNPYKVRCCESAPYVYNPTSVTVGVSYGIDLIKTTTVVSVDNKPANMIINVFK
jgi:hypothetical protein